MDFSAKINTIIETDCLLGEGAYYSAYTKRAYWVDIRGHALYRMDWYSRRIKKNVFDTPVCWVVELTDGDLLVGFARSIERLNGLTWSRTVVTDIAQEPMNNRLNDAKVDNKGRLFFGTMDDNERLATGALYRLNRDYSLTMVDKGYVVSNGPATSPCGNWFYSVESKKRIIYRFRLTDDGVLIGRTPFISFKTGMGVPDGITVDASGRVWVAAWGGGGVYCFSEQGERLGFIPLPALNVTSISFAGDSLKSLLITSAKTDLSAKELQAYPHCGSTFIIEVNSCGKCPAQAKY